MARPKVSVQEFARKIAAIPDIEFARLAAYIDGEGCIVISSCAKPRGRGASKTHEMKMTVTNTYLPLFAWIVGTFGGTVAGANSNHNRPNTKRCYRWLLNEVQSEMILRRCLPYFIIKREQAEIALLFRDIKRRKFDDWRNGKLTAAMVAERDHLQKRISDLNQAKGFGLKKLHGGGKLESDTVMSKEFLQ